VLSHDILQKTILISRFWSNVSVYLKSNLTSKDFWIMLVSKLVWHVFSSEFLRGTKSSLVKDRLKSIFLRLVRGMHFERKKFIQQKLWVLLIQILSVLKRNYFLRSLQWNPWWNKCMRIERRQRELVVKEKESRINLRSNWREKKKKILHVLITSRKDIRR
jgi:hypothetical protein